MAIDLARLRSLHAAATQGEWYSDSSADLITSQTGRTLARMASESKDEMRANKDCVCALHNAAPGLIARAELLEEIMGMISRNGEWDDGCFYYNRHSASEMGTLLERYRALEADRG